MIDLHKPAKSSLIEGYADSDWPNDLKKENRPVNIISLRFMVI